MSGIEKCLTETVHGDALFIGYSESLRSSISQVVDGKIIPLEPTELPNVGDRKPFLALQREEIHPLGRRYPLVVVELSPELEISKLLWAMNFLIAFRGKLALCGNLSELGSSVELFRESYNEVVREERCLLLSPKKERIAVATDDGKTIPVKMLGRAAKFLIFELTEGELYLAEVRENPYKDTAQRRKTLDVYDVLRDCSVVISAFIGKRGTERLRLRSIKMFFTRGSIEEALRNFLKEEGLTEVKLKFNL